MPEIDKGVEMSSIRRSARAIALAGTMLVAVAVSACSGGSPDVDGEGGDPVVRFSGLPDMAPLPTLVMQEEGIDEKYGFKAEFVEIDPDIASTSFLMGGSEIAIDQDAVSSSIANNEGHDVVSFYPALANTASIVVGADTGIESVDDLAGKRVGHFGMDSGTTQAITVSLKEEYDIDVKDFELVQSSPASLPELLASGEVDAIFDYEPYAANGVKLADGKYLFEVTPYWEEATGWSPALAMLTGHREWLRDNPDLARNILKAWQEAEVMVSDSDYEMFLEEPYAAFLDRDSKEELQTLVDYCADLECFPGEWDEDDVKEQEKYLGLMVDLDMLDAVPDKAPTATLENILNP